MSSIEEREAYLKNPYFEGHLYGDFTPFYIAIGICTAIGAFLLVLNIICCCFSDNRWYWKDKHSGNRWLVPLWTSTAHNQPPLDLSELKDYRPEAPTVTTGVEYTAVHMPQFEEKGSRPLRPQRHLAEEYVEMKQQQQQIHTKSRESEI